MSNTLPPTLYKYRPWNDYTEAIFTRQELYFAAPRQFNDPFDCGFHILCQGDRNQEIFAPTAFRHVRTKHPDLTLDEMVEAAQQISAAIATDHLDEVTAIFNKKLAQVTNLKVGILTLTERNDDILMWSHYADQHRGVCIEFRTDGDAGMFSMAQPVIYRDEYPHLNLRSVVESETLRAAADWMLTKSSEWSYEQEWRVLDFNAGPGAQRFPDNCLSSVTLGCRFPDEERKKVMNWTRSFSHPVTIFQAKPSPTHFRLEMETVR